MTVSGNNKHKKFVLCAPDPKMVTAWHKYFDSDDRFEINQSTVLRSDVDAWSTASDSHMGMGGGLDRAIAQRLPGIDQIARKFVAELYHGFMPVGQAAVIPSGYSLPSWVILVPTMPYPMVLQSEEPIYLATLALLKVVYQHPRILRVSVPAYGTGVGRIPPDKAAAAMHQAVVTYDQQVHRD